MSDHLSGSRRDYSMGSLDENDVDPSPVRQFDRWLAQIGEQTNVVEANAMTLATVGDDGHPSARIVLLKGFDDRGLVFFSNYDSQKGSEIDAHPQVSCVFYWPALERQVRVRGVAARIAETESDAYFTSRPPGSQIGAAASPQSSVVENRKSLERRFAELEDQVARGEPVMRPERWGGYRIAPWEFEFWQGRPNRLHDRVRYRLVDGQWEIVRLAP
ncbi:MAG: pyridoxamine 5'-phosphate oxidase [Chloroflexia bacterium]|nr:pyridoxamine 5'-phosphate oxidase [Chloroflexia bacterium]